MITLACLFAAACIANPTVHTAPTPSWVVKAPASGKQPNPRDVKNGYYLKLFEREINVATNEDYEHVIKDIVSAAGVQEASNISLDFNPSYEQLALHQVTIWRNGQPIDRTKTCNIKVLANEEDLQMFIYNGNYTAYVILDDIRKGDQIEYAYTIKGSNPIMPKQYYSFAFEIKEPISQLHYYMVNPASRAFTLKYFNNAPQPVVANSGSNVTYDWQLQDIPAGKYSDISPSWFYSHPYVQLSEYKSWQEVATWAHTINVPTDKLSGALSTRIAELKKSRGNDSAALFRDMVEIVQNEVRYMGVEIGAYSHKANNPDRVYGQRYGDCKDKSLLLVSMLHNAGFGAEVALVNTTRKSKIEESLPGPYAFNHAIVLAHFAGKDVWVDPTMSYLGGKGTDFYCPPYGKALILDPATTALKNIPEMPGGELSYNETYTIASESSPATLTIYTKYTGQRANNARMQFASESKAATEKNYLDYYTKVYPHIESTDTLTINDDLQANVLETIERYSIADFLEYDATKRNYQGSFYASMLKGMLPEVEKSRDFPIALSYPNDVHYTIRVESATNWDIQQVNDRIVRDGYTFEYGVATDSRALTITYNLIFHKDNIAPGEIAQYEKDRKKIVDDYLSFGFSYATGKSASPGIGSVNLWALLVFVVLLWASTYVCKRIYTQTTTRSTDYGEPKPIAGWLILPALGLVFGCVKLAYTILSTGYFLNKIWHVFDSQNLSTAYTALLWGEFAANCLILFMNVFCILLFFKKRDILPKAIIILYVASVVVIISDSILAAAMSITTEIDYANIARAMIAAAIWIPYFSTAQQVKETFVIAYPDLGYWPPRQEQPHFTTQATEKKPETAEGETTEGSNPDNHDRFLPPGTKL